jgi:soluble lytic murein transglycosylase-like protein
VLHPRPEGSRREWGSSRSKEELALLAQQAAERHRIDPILVRAMIEAESNWNTAAVSSRGALGLMQLVPATAERFGVANAFDPGQNLEAGVRYLRLLLEGYDGDLDKALAAYNAGERAVEAARGVPKFPETQAYVKKVTDSYFRPDSGRLPTWWATSLPIYRIVGRRGRWIFTNE